MQRPLEPDEDRQRCNGDADYDLDKYRPYLNMLVRLQLDDALKAKVDASDIVQLTLFEAHRSHEDFRGESEQQRLAWLRSILARNLADEMRKFSRQKRNVHLEQSLQAAVCESAIRVERWLASEEGTPSQNAIVNEQLVGLALALMRLPVDQRKAVEMHHLQGLSSADIAKHLGRSEVAVAGLLRRGLKKLREWMHERDPR